MRSTLEIQVVNAGVKEGLFELLILSVELFFLHLLPCRRADTSLVYTLVLYMQSSTRCRRLFFAVTHLHTFFINHNVINVINLTTSSYLPSYIDYLIISWAKARRRNPTVCSKLASLNDHSSSHCQLTLIAQQMPPILLYIRMTLLKCLCLLLL